MLVAEKGFRAFQKLALSWSGEGVQRGRQDEWSFRPIGERCSSSLLLPTISLYWVPQCEEWVGLCHTAIVPMETGGLEQLLLPTLSSDWDHSGRCKGQWKGSGFRLNIYTAPSPAIISSIGKSPLLEMNDCTLNACLV